MAGSSDLTPAADVATATHDAEPPSEVDEHRGGLATAQRVGDEGRVMNLSGVGRSFVWTTLKTIASLLGSAALVGYNVRILGPTAYGSVATITAWMGLLTVMAGALRYAVVRVAAVRGDHDEGGDAQATSREAISASHSAFVSGAMIIAVAGIAFGWCVPVDLGLHGSQLTHVYFATMLFILGAAVAVATSAFAGVLVARESFGLIAVITLAAFGVQVALTLALVRPLHVIGIGIAAVGGGLAQAAAYYIFGHRCAPWLALTPRRIDRQALFPVLRYAGGVAVLWLASVVEASSDPFVIGALRGGEAVTIFRIGSMVPTSVVALLYFAFGVLFPRLARTPSAAEQEEGVAWTGRVVGWVSGLAFGGLVLLGSDAVRLFLGRSDEQAVTVLVICSCALCLDVCFHGVEQVLLARGEQSVLARYMAVDLVVNLGATVIGVILFGPVGSAIALAATIGIRDLIAFPLIMRGRWLSPAGRFVWRNGAVQSMVAGVILVGSGYPIVRSTTGVPLHVLCVGTLAVAILVGSVVAVGAAERRRLMSVMGRGTHVERSLTWTRSSVGSGSRPGVAEPARSRGVGATTPSSECSVRQSEPLSTVAPPAGFETHLYRQGGHANEDVRRQPGAMP